MTVAGIVCNHIAFLIALIGIHRLALRHTSRSAALLAVWLTALGPLSFVFSMLYPSALFLAASVWAFVWIEQDHDRAAGLAAAVAALSRPNGVVVLIALVDRGRIRATTRHADRCARRGSSLRVGGVQRDANRRSIPLLRRQDRLARDHRADTSSQRPTPDALLHLTLAALAVALVLIGRRRIPSSWSWFTVLYLLPSLALGVVGLARYATETFPPYIAGGRPPRTTRQHHHPTAVRRPDHHPGRLRLLLHHRRATDLTGRLRRLADDLPSSCGWCQERVARLRMPLIGFINRLPMPHASRGRRQPQWKRPGFAIIGRFVEEMGSARAHLRRPAYREHPVGCAGIYALHVRRRIAPTVMPDRARLRVRFMRRRCLLSCGPPNPGADGGPSGGAAPAVLRSRRCGPLNIRWALCSPTTSAVRLCLRWSSQRGVECLRW